MLESLLAVNSMYEKHGDGTDLEGDIAATARQNQAALAEPVHSYELALIVSRHALKLTWPQPSQNHSDAHTCKHTQSQACSLRHGQTHKPVEAQQAGRVPPDH